jgi:hypothetical protein
MPAQGTYSPTIITTTPSVAIRRDAHARVSNKESRFQRKGCARVPIVSLFPTTKTATSSYAAIMNKS